MRFANRISLNNIVTEEFCYSLELNEEFDESVDEHKPSKVEDNSTIKHSSTFSKDHHKAIDSYKRYSYDDINNSLRKSKGKKVSSHYKDHVKLLDHVSSEKTVAAKHVYRSMPKSAKDLKVGSVIKEHGYSSTSHDPKVAKKHSKEKTIAKIHLPKGTKSHHIDKIYNGNEKEVLLSRGTSFKVTGHSQHKGFHVVHMTVHGQD